MRHITKNVGEPWFTQIASKKKTIEGRLSKGDFAELTKGDHVTWTNADMGFQRSVKTEVVRVTRYTTFKKYLMAEKLANALPSHGITTVDKGVKVYRQFYDKIVEKEHGVLAIQVKVITK